MWSDSYWIRDLLGGLRQLGWTRTAWTPTAWLEPEQELVSRTDVVGLFLADSDCLAGLRLLGWTPTAWLDPEQ